MKVSLDVLKAGNKEGDSPKEDQQEEESVHLFYVLIHVLIKLNLKP